jgi:3-deoxy-D-manno-octulosonic-acid transferase
MARSLGLAAYRALSRRKSRPSAAFSRPRPEGELLWLHATSPDRLEALCELGIRMQSQREFLKVLITVEQDDSAPAPDMSKLEATGLQADQLASDHPAEARDFLDHWKPDICLWAGASLMPNLISETAERGIPMILIDASQSDFSARKHKWSPI